MKNIRYGLNIFKCPASARMCRNYSDTKTINPKLHPYYATGFFDGVFPYCYSKKSYHQNRMESVPHFFYMSSYEGQNIVGKIRVYFGVGEIRKSGKTPTSLGCKNSKILKCS